MDGLIGLTGRFSTILADPPWRFQNRTGKVAPEHVRLRDHGGMRGEVFGAEYMGTMQVVTITRRPHGYFLTHVEGKRTPTVNGKQLETQTYPLYSNDIIELGGVKLQFLNVSPS